MQDILSPADDAQLIANGYSPIACAGKAAVAQGWQSGPITIERLAAMRELNPTARNTGIRTDDLVAIDIDVQNPEHVEKIVSLAFELLGATSLCRVGSKGCMLVYRAAAPLRKVTVLTDAVTKGDFADKIEVLGIGTQFVAFGIHPDGMPYQWTGKDDFDETATPLNTPLETVPEVPLDRLLTFTQRGAELLNVLGYVNPRVRRSDEHEKIAREAGSNEDAEQNIDRATAHLRNLVESGKVAVLGALGNDTIYELACVLMDRFYLSEDMAGKLMLDIWYPHCHPNHLTDDVLSIVSHAASYIQNEPGARALPPVASVFGAALDKLPTDDVAEGPGEVEHDPGRAQDLQLLDENFDDGSLPISGDELSEGEYPPLREIVPGWMERNVNTMHEGPPATHKSRSLLMDALCIQAGLMVFGQKVEKCECLYLNYENDIKEIKRRVHDIRAMLRVDNQSPEVDVSGFHLWNLNLTNAQILIVSRDGIRITRFGKRLLKYLEDRRDAGVHTVVIFDGLMDAIVFKDNTRNDEFMAMALIRTLDLWCKQLDCSMQSIYHPGRSAERMGSIGSYAMAWSAKPRCIQTYAVILSPDAPPGNGKNKGKVTDDTPIEHKWVQRRVSKHSNGPEGARMWLQYWKGGLRPHPPTAKRLVQPEATPPADDETDEIPF